MSDESNIEQPANSPLKSQGRRILFLDRDGVILQEPPTDFQVDSIAKTSFVPGSITALARIAAELDYYKVMVTNQDGLGTDAYPDIDFYPYQDMMLRTLEGEGFVFDEIIIDKTFAADNVPTRKPGTALLKHLIDCSDFDLPNSLVVGDRWSDIQPREKFRMQSHLFPLCITFFNC
jgi:imidazoleglycerol-phosphate dehydratase/histidinol-phosphatase